MSLVYLRTHQDLLSTLGTESNLDYLGVLYDTEKGEIAALLAEHVIPAGSHRAIPLIHWLWESSPGHFDEIRAPDEERARDFIRLSTGRIPPEHLTQIRRTHVPWYS